MTTHLTPNRLLGISGSLWDPEALGLPRYAFPGGAEISYLCRDGFEICWECAEEQISESLSYLIGERSESGDRTIPEMLSEEDLSDLIALDLSSERDSCSYCDQCSRVIPSAYCDPESDPSAYCDQHAGSREALSEEPESDPEPEDLGEHLAEWLGRCAEPLQIGGEEIPSRIRLSESFYGSEGEILLSVRIAEIGLSEEDPPALSLSYRGDRILDRERSSVLCWDATAPHWERISLAGKSDPEARIFALAAITRLDPLRFAPDRSVAWDLLRICESLRYWEGSCDSGDLWGSALVLSWEICSLLDLRDRGDLIPESLGYRAGAGGAEISPGVQSLSVYRSETLGALLPEIHALRD